MTEIRYLIGDATTPDVPSSRIGELPHVVIAHVVNNRGAWGAGFTGALSKRWPRTKTEYKAWSFNLYEFGLALGKTLIVGVDPVTRVAHMCAQSGYGRDGKVRVDYHAIRLCLRAVAFHCLENDASVHAPRFGCGLGGGSWDVIEGLIQDELCMRGIDVTIYDLPAAPGNDQ